MALLLFLEETSKKRKQKTHGLNKKFVWFWQKPTVIYDYLIHNISNYGTMKNVLTKYKK